MNASVQIWEPSERAPLSNSERRLLTLQGSRPDSEDDLLDRLAEKIESAIEGAIAEGSAHATAISLDNLDVSLALRRPNDHLDDLLQSANLLSAVTRALSEPSRPKTRTDNPLDDQNLEQIAADLETVLSPGSLS